jgi:hypothetical protein
MAPQDRRRPPLRPRNTQVGPQICPDPQQEGAVLVDDHPRARALLRAPVMAECSAIKETAQR